MIAVLLVCLSGTPLPPDLAAAVALRQAVEELHAARRRETSSRPLDWLVPAAGDD